MGRGTTDGRFSGAARHPGMGDPRRPAPENRHNPRQGRTRVVTSRRIRPAGNCPVGGDWCEIIDLPGARTGLVVGDAMGHGPRAATAMTRLRLATRVLARAGLPPHSLLASLNRLAGDATFATCAYAVVDATAGSAAIALAGHPPPVRILPGGSAHVIDLPPGLPLGVGRADFRTVTVPLPPGGTLAIYTNGLVQSRTCPIGEGILALTDVLAGSPAPLPATSEAVIRALGSSTEDDIALLLARIERVPVVPAARESGHERGQ